MDTYEHLKESLEALSENIQSKFQERTPHEDDRFHAPEDDFCCGDGFLYPTFCIWCEMCKQWECPKCQDECYLRDADGVEGDLGGIR